MTATSDSEREAPEGAPAKAGVAPPPATASAPTAATATATATPTVERRPELRCLHETLEAAAAGEGATVVVEGVAGAGKTHLLERAAAHARELGMLTLFSAGSPLAAAASFGLVLELTEPLLSRRAGTGELPDRLSHLLGPGYEHAPGDDGTAALACLALARVCERAAAEVPLALIVDDVHWADAASLQAVAAIARRTPRTPLAVIAALRLGEELPDPGAVAELRGEPPARVLRVGPLSTSGVGELLEARLGAPVAEDAAATCARLTGGNPLLVTQIATILGEGSGPVTAERLEGLGERAVSVAAAVEARLNRLGEEATALVAACAILGDEAPTRHVIALAELTEADAVAALDRLTAVGLLEPGEPLRFTHPLVRDAVYQARPPAARAQAHTRAAELLSAAGADPQQVAAQLLRARPSGSAQTVGALVAAAEQAMSRGVPTAAAVYLERALEEPPLPDQRARVLLSLGFAEALLGRPGAAERLAAARQEATTPRLRAEADLRLGRHLYATGEYAEAERALERGRAALAADSGGEEGEGDWLASQLEASSLAAARYAGTLDGRGGSERLAAVLRRRTAGESPDERALLAELAVELGVRGEPREQVVALAMRAWADGALAATADRHGIVVSQVAAALVWSDAGEEAETVLDAAIAHAREVGAATGAATGRYMRSWLRLYQGDLEAARADATAALGTAGWDMYLPAAHSVLAHVEVERADLDAAAAALELPGGDDRWHDSVPFALVLEARGRLAAERGEDEAALTDLLACGERMSPMGPHQPFSRWRVEAALCLGRLGEDERAIELADAELKAARRAGAPRVLGTALSARGVLADGEEGAALLNEAVAVLGVASTPIEEARALLRLGEKMRRDGRQVEARDPLREALSIADAVGARLVAEEAAAELNAAGGRPRRRALAGAASLTPAERRVARLAAAGLTNRAIAERLVVAEKTVQFHLTNAYRKLGAGSREDLAGLLDDERR